MVEMHELLQMEDILIGLVEALGEEDGVVVDLGDNTIAALKCGIPKNQYIGGTGALGGSLSVAMGHAIVNPLKGEIFCIMGDGGFGLHFNSLVTAAINQDKIKRLTIVVLDDSSWGMTGGQQTTPTSLGLNYESAGRAMNLSYCSAVSNHNDLKNACLKAKETLGVKLIIAKCKSL